VTSNPRFRLVVMALLLGDDINKSGSSNSEWQQVQDAVHEFLVWAA
jgi:hypothetical protein